MQHDFQKTASALVRGTERAIAAAVAPLLKRIEALEGRPAPERGEKGDPGESGADGRGLDVAEQRDGVLVLRLTDGSEQEVGRVKGEDGRDGTDAPPADAEAIADMFRPIAESIVSQAVAAGIATLPPPEKGEKGDQGKPGADGANGCGIADLLVDRDGNLIATFEDGRMKSVGPAQGKDGAPGRDGFSLEDFDIEAGEDGRTVTLKFQQGETLHSYELVFPAMIYRGVFKEGHAYVSGDVVTWGGSAFVAERETSAKPDSQDSGFRLAVKRGRDGKDGKDLIKVEKDTAKV